MQLGVATPGVSPATIRDCISATPTTVVRLTRCGQIGVPTDAFSSVTIWLRQCAVSVHATEQFLRSLQQSIARRIRILDASTVPAKLQERFDCPVSTTPAAPTQCWQSTQHR